MKDHTSHIDIPKAFYSDETGAPFQECLGCNLNLLDSGTDYLIEKAYRRYPKYGTQDTVFEYAMCFDCVLKIQEAMSAESTQRVRAYFDQHVDLFARDEALGNKDVVNIKDWLSNCMVKGQPVSAMTEYQIYGHCVGGKLQMTMLPYAIGGEAIDEISNLLSNKTIDEIDGFMDEHFGLPPELRKLLLDNNVLLV